MADIQDPQWVALKPSSTNLILTLASGVLAMASLWLIDIPEWLRAVILLVALIVLVFDVYLIRFKSRDAVNAFYLFERDVAVVPMQTFSPPEGNQSAAKIISTSEWAVRIRYANPGKRKKSINNDAIEVAEGVVTRTPYVSTYFTTIPYRLPNDPVWRRWFPHVLALWADSLDRDQFRQVRVKLKWR